MHDLVTQPIETVAGVYAHFGLPFDAAATGAMRAWIADNPQHKHGTVATSLEEFGLTLGAVRDAAFVQWRYATRPDAGYRLVVASRAGRAAGWFAHRSLALRGIPAGFVVDFVLAPDETEAGATLLRAAAGLARAEGAALLSALRPGSGPARRALGRAGFLPVPEALHPQVIRFSVRGLGADAQRTDWLQPRAWTLGWSDTDVV